MNPSTSINCFFDPEFTVPVEVQIQRLYDAGFRTLDMNFLDWCHSPRSPFMSEGWASWVEGIAAFAKGLGIRFTQAHGYVYNFYELPGAGLPYALCERSLQGAAMLGIDWVVFHPCMHPSGDEAMTLADNHAFFAPLAELAQKLSTGIALENMRTVKHSLVSAEQLCALIDRLDSPAAGACWDTGHAHIAGVPQGESIRMFGHRLKALHVQDNNGVQDQHMPPYFGSIHWPTVMEALRDISFAHDFTFEAQNIVRCVPEGIKAQAARMLYQIGAELVRTFSPDH